LASECIPFVLSTSPLTRDREIIDESDVYIDVHKAIRRMAPAPKARVQRGHVIGHPDNPVVHAPEDDLIDLRERQSIEIAKRLANGDHHSSIPVAVFGTSPKTTFLRRSSSGADGHPIAVRGNANDMREELKHLGPSNLASRPKTTRYQTVKIKPGAWPGRSGSRTESTGYPHSVVDEPYQDHPAAHAGEGEGLLRSAGVHAKDGVQALQQGYGSLSYSTSPKNAKSEMATTDGTAPYQRPPSRKSFKEQSPDSISRHHSDRSSDTLGSLQSGVSPTRRRKGTARSGSITENIIEAGGFQKVVLQTTSSSDREDSGSSNTGKKSGQNSPTITPKPPPAALDRAPEETRPATPKGEEVKKKRRRNRKKKGAKSGEEGSTAGGSTTG
jgi:metal transporter CNNM